MTIWVHRLFIHIFKAYNLSHFCSITKSKGFQLQPKLFFFVVIKSFSPFSKFFLHFEFFFLFFDFEIYFLTLKKIIYFEKVFFVECFGYHGKLMCWCQIFSFLFLIKTKNEVL